MSFCADPGFFLRVLHFKLKINIYSMTLSIFVQVEIYFLSFYFMLNYLRTVITVVFCVNLRLFFAKKTKNPQKPKV